MKMKMRIKMGGKEQRKLGKYAAGFKGTINL
jgi:hypothetical protein